MEDYLEIYIRHCEINTKIQGSKEWIEGRKFSIGCSELYNAVGTNISRINMVQKKFVPSDISKVAAIIWGHSFENTTRKYTSLMMNCEISECPGSILLNSGCNLDGKISCSPDGLGVIKLPISIIAKTLLKREDAKCRRKTGRCARPTYQTVIEKFDPHEYRKQTSQLRLPKAIALFEYKSPISRNLSDNVEYEYSYQVLGGLNVINIAKIGIFVECRFTSCEPSDLAFNDKYYDFSPSISLDYNNSVNSGTFAKQTPLMIGCKFYIYKADCATNSTDLLILRTKDDFQTFAFLDYSSDYYAIDSPVVYFADGKYNFEENDFVRILDIIGYNIEPIKALVAKMQASVAEQNIFASLWLDIVCEIEEQNKSNPNSDDDLIMGYIPWKLFDAGFFYVYNVDDFLKSHQENLSKAISIMEIVANLPEDQRAAELNEMRKRK